MDNLEPITRNEMFLNGDDLEPITREEMILAGADLEPITRHEWFLKKYRGGGGGGGYDLVNIPNLPADIASFNDGTDLPMASLKVAVTPYQDLHGYDAPWAGGAGKNKLNSTVRASQTVNGITSEVKADNTIVASGESTQNGDINVSVTPFTLKAGTYTISINGTDTRTRTIYFWLYAGGYHGPYTIEATNHSATFTTSEDYNVTSVMFRTGSGGEVNINARIQLESGSNSTSYAPYSNICPIIGWDEAVVTVADDAESPTTSHEYTIDLDGTRYGGVVDVLNGTMDDTLDHIASYNGEALSSTWISDRDVYAEGTTPTIGAEVVYTRATPITVQLAPTPAKSLEGVNKIYANCGQITEVKYFKKA